MNKIQHPTWCRDCVDLRYQANSIVIHEGRVVDVEVVQHDTVGGTLVSFELQLKQVDSYPGREPVPGPVKVVFFAPDHESSEGREYDLGVSDARKLAETVLKLTDEARVTTGHEK